MAMAMAMSTGVLAGDGERHCSQTPSLRRCTIFSIFLFGVSLPPHHASSSSFACSSSCDGEEAIIKRAFQAGSRNGSSKSGRGRSVKVMAVSQVSLESRMNAALVRFGTRGR